MILNPKKIQEKADILETNLYKTISSQKDPARIQIRINRQHFPDLVINKALLQLMPRFNIKPSLYIMGLRNLMQKETTPGKTQTFFTELREEGNNLYDEDKVIARGFEAILSKEELVITITGLQAVPSIDGHIAESYFEHEQSAGKLLKDGVINFKEINRYPIVNAGDNLFYILHEKQGSAGISFDGKLMAVKEAIPLQINIGPGVERIDDIDEATGLAKGYYLKADKTGVVILDRDDKGTVRHIEISDQVNIKRLDYSVGNIGTRYTCPVQANIGVICNGFKIRVNGAVHADISEGAEITTNNEAHIALVQTGSKIIALKDITAHSAGGSKIYSEAGCVTIKNEMIDSTVAAPEIVFNKTNGLLTNNTIKTGQLVLKGLNFSGVNIIYFGSELFRQKEELIASLGEVRNKLGQLETNEKLLMGQLQMELKRLTKLTSINPDLAKHIKPVILATKTMDYTVIFREMDLIQKQYNTKAVVSARKLFDALEKIPISAEVYSQKKETINSEIRELDRQMSMMKIDLEGTLRKAATIKVFCGSLEKKDISKPDFMLESEGDKTKYIRVTGSYSHQKGFEFVQ